MKQKRIAATFAKLRKQQRTGLITFFMANDPTPKDFVLLLSQLPQSGVDVIEIGMPFSDPVADGVSIQASGIRSLKHKTNLDDILNVVSDFRKKHQTPIVLMGYINPIFNYGYQEFFERASQVGVDAVIIVDVPPEEEGEIRPIVEANNIDLIRLITPTTNKKRMMDITQNCSGFLYYVSVSGITGTKSALLEEVQERIEQIRTTSGLPIAVGFGIKDASGARAVGELADAIVVGSTLIDFLYQQYHHGKSGDELIKEVVIKIAEFRRALDS